jgi:hypothetical protein
MNLEWFFTITPRKSKHKNHEQVSITCNDSDANGECADGEGCKRIDLHL